MQDVQGDILEIVRIENLEKPLLLGRTNFEKMKFSNEVVI